MVPAARMTPVIAVIGDTRDAVSAAVAMVPALTVAGAVAL
jgi:hypothetical protein